VAAALVSSPSYAKDAIYTSLFNNTAVSGYDAVSYFQEDGPVEGVKEFTTQYEGANWLFSSQENLDLAPTPWVSALRLKVIHCNGT